MNKQRRKKISDAINIIQTAIDKLKDVLQDEEMAFDNMPENLQYSERGETSQEAIDVLNESIDQIEEAISSLEDLT